MFECSLLYGMTSQEFWFGNPQDYFVYQDAFAKKQKFKNEENDICAWMNASYILDALRQSLSEFGGKPKPFFNKKPRCIEENQEEQKEVVTKHNPLLAKFLQIQTAINNTIEGKMNGN